MVSLSTPAGSFELLETMAYLPRVGLRNEAAHLARLTASASYFGFRLDVQDVRKELSRSLAGVHQPRRVRVTVRRTGAFAVELDLMPSTPTRPVRLTVDPEPVCSHSVWLLHKTTRREAYDVRAARHPYADDVLLVNEHGQLTESTIANLAVRLDGTWLTPPVGSGCLPGVERTRLVHEGRLTERILSFADLQLNDGLALVNSLRGWRFAALVSSSA